MPEVVEMRVRLMWGRLVNKLVASYTCFLPGIPMWPNILVSEIYIGSY